MVTLFRIIVCFLPLTFLAQDFKLGERKSFFQTAGAIYPVKSLNSSNQFLYLNGHSSYFIDNHFALRGDMWSKKTKSSSDTEKEFRTQLSMLYFFNIKRFSIYTGFGTSLPTIRTPMLEKKQLMPTTSLILGSQFIVHDYFYFFLDTQLNMRKSVFSAQWFSTICVSGGLGLQLPTHKLLKSNFRSKV